MAGGNHKTFGMSMMVIMSIVFFYYSFWVLILPFVDRDHALQTYFPDRWIALAIPVTILVVVSTLSVAFIGLVMIRTP